MFMPFYEIDLTQLIPHGVPLNSSNKVVARQALNEFFLKGFENWFKQLFKTVDGVLERDYSRSTCRYNSLEACNKCTDAQLADAIVELGFPYYSGNLHEVNALFLYNMYNNPPELLDSVCKYCANSNEVEFKAVYNPENYNNFMYTIRVYGDLTSIPNIQELPERLFELVSKWTTAGTYIKDMQLRDVGTEIGAYVGAYINEYANYKYTDIIYVNE